MRQQLTLSPNREPVPLLPTRRNRPPAATGLTECGRIASIVAATFGVAKGHMLSQRRTQELAVPRMVAIYLAFRTTALPLSVIGRQFERDHTSVSAAVNRIIQLSAEDGNLREKVLICEDRVRDQQHMAAFRLVDRAAATYRDAITQDADRAFELDPAGATAAIASALRDFLKAKEGSK